MRILFALIFFTIVIVVAINFSGLVNDAEVVEPVYSGLSGQFLSEIRKLEKTNQIDKMFFSAEKIKVNDYRQNKSLALDLKVLSEAFKGAGKKTPHEIAIDIFEANDSEGKVATKIVFQINLIEIKSQNKISEYAISL